MKLPKQALRVLTLLADDFCGEVRVHHNGCGAFVIEVKHQQRFVAKDDELVDLEPELQPGGWLALPSRPRR